VVAGQQAENLLDFDDTPTEGQPSGLAATQILPSSPAAANFLSGASTNPLDDLVSIFGGMSASGGIGGVEGAFGGLGSISPPSGNHVASPLESLGSPTTTQKPQEDLLGLF
jgi:AP-1 complex subunit beta-1